MLFLSMGKPTASGVPRAVAILAAVLLAPGVCAGAVNRDASPVGFKSLSGLLPGVSGLRLTACAHGAPVSADSLVGSERHGELGASTPW